MKRVFLGFALVISLHSMSQGRISDHNDIEWLNTTITKHLSDRFSGSVEYNWRRTDWFKNGQQGELKAGINYAVNDQLNAQLSYTWNTIFPYGDYNLSSIPKPFTEHSISEQVTVTAKMGRATLASRFRLDQKWSGRYTDINSAHTDYWLYFNKARYLGRLDIPVCKQFTASASDEIIMSFGKNVGENVFDQNRLIFLAVHKISPSLKIEAGTIFQVIELGREVNSKNVFQYNSGLVLNTILQLK